jgi:hypothetical protein
MKCPSCNVDNKDTARNCKKCGMAFDVEPIWSPTWQWHAKSLGIIYACLIIAYFLLNIFLKPYLRQIPMEVTPWLKDAQTIHKK